MFDGDSGGDESDGDSGGDESDDAVETSSVEVAGAISGFGQTLSLLSSGCVTSPVASSSSQLLIFEIKIILIKIDYFDKNGVIEKLCWPRV